MANKMDQYRLKDNQLTSEIKIDTLEFNDTSDIVPLDGIVGQTRAEEALEFGMRMKLKGYNIYAAGPIGTGKSTYIKQVLLNHSKENYDKTKIKDYVYVYNFKNHLEPIYIELAAGEGAKFKKNISSMVQQITREINKVFQSTKYESQSMDLNMYYDGKVDEIIGKLNDKASKKGLAFDVTGNGIISTPLNKDGNKMTESEVEALTDEEYSKYKANSAKMTKELSKTIDELRKSEEAYCKEAEEIENETAKSVIDGAMDKYIKLYKSNKKIVDYLKNMRSYMLENIDRLKVREDGPRAKFPRVQRNNNNFFMKFEVNLFLDNSETNSMPVIKEINPTYYNINGFYEYKNKMGNMITTFMDLKPGALHKANGGYLIINIKDLLSNNFAWEGLKRALKTERITIDSLMEYSSYIISTTIKPEPIPCDVKIILVGDYETYVALYEYDDDFQKLFRVMVEFETYMKNTKKNQEKFIRSIAYQCNQKNIKHLDRSAAFEMIKYSNRLSESKDKLSCRYNKIIELLNEAYLLSENSKLITSEHIKNAQKNKVKRNNSYEEELNEMYLDGTLLIDVTGEKIGQINGLTVLQEGEYSFGKPARITASSYMGEEGIINIEREVKHSGSSFDKGMMILSGYIGERYGKDKLLSFTSSITFEQSYGYIDGDSASSTELYALISAIGEIPIKQNIAVTGSISQKGEIQPIGGVNEKIEGFFDICNKKGLTGDQGVLIPQLNVNDLVLKDEVIEACKQEKFHIYAVNTIDEGLFILTGLTRDKIDEKVNEVFETYRKNLEDDDSEEETKKQKKN